MRSLHDRLPVSDEKHYEFDVVCGMDIKAAKASRQSEFRGSIYYFCSPACQKHFDDFPERYIGEEV